MKISAHCRRYFADDAGATYIPVGLNICFHRCPPDATDEATHDRETLEWYGRMFRDFSVNGGNFTRLWLGNRFFDVMPDEVGKFSARATENLRAVIRLAERHGIRIKLTMEHFRFIKRREGKRQFEKWGAADWEIFNKPIFAPYAATMDEYLDSPICRQAYLDKARYMAEQGFGDSPAVAAIELWNEINCIGTVYDHGKVASWSEYMAGRLQDIFPRQLIVQNIGSFSEIDGYRIYDYLDTMAQNAFLQVHRYLDPGAPLDVCHAPADVLAADAIRHLSHFHHQTPMILAECGAVEACHAGPSKLYDADAEGTLLHDMLFAPFFAGAAGCGQFWHWDSYVEKHRLWHHFKRFANAIAGIDPADEAFLPFYTETRRLRLHGLHGKRHTLIWCRDKQNGWREELSQGIAPELLDCERLPRLYYGDSPMECYLPWEDRHACMTSGDDGWWTLPPFRRSIVLRFQH